MERILKYDVDTLSTGATNIETLKTAVEKAKDDMVNGLAQVRLDWVSEGGDAFFNSIDNDWTKSVQNCIDVLDDILSAIKKAETTYAEIETESPNYLKF